MRPIVNFMILSLVLALAGDAVAQTSNATKGHKATPAGKATNQPAQAAPANKPPNADPVSQLGSDLANTVINVTGDPDDHVRCFFTDKQLADLRPVPTVPRLTEADQSRVLTSIIQAATTASDAELTRAQKAAFINELAKKLDGQLVGKTPGEALASIMDILYTVKQDASKGVTKYINQDVTQELMYSVTQGTNKDHTNEDTNDKSLDDANGTVNAVAASARSAINKIAAPVDIGCAYQILSWNQARLLFGRSVANDYIAVQITVRNVNPKEEFIVHNAMLSVDTDIHGSMGRFFESDDKFSVEAYNTAGEPLTTRGIIANSITATSTLLSVLQPIVSVANFSNAVAAFTGGVVPGFKTISPDHQKEQLLLIANSGFSASDTKTVVGKSSAATFYTWFPAKPFLEGWWVQDCAKNIASVNKMREDPENSGKELSPAPDTGVDKVRARYACQTVSGDTWKTIPYQKWSSLADDLFRGLSLAVVAGIHVQEDNKNKPFVSEMKCPTDAKGNIDLSKGTSDGVISCTITGENLDKVKKLHLENKANAVDPDRPEANVDAQDTSGKADFKLSDLAAASGTAYTVYMVAKDGTETAAGVPPMHLDPSAVILIGPKDSNIDLGKTPEKLSLTGYHLDKLTKVCFIVKTPSAPSSITADAVSTSSTQASVDLKSTSSLFQGTWQIYPADCASNPKSGSISVTISGSTPLSPVITSFTPKSGAEGTMVIIEGDNLAGASVSFGGMPATPSVASATSISVTVPKGAKSGAIKVTKNGKEASKNGFRVLPKILAAPRLKSLPSKPNAASPK
jgi:hypothetical protein